MVKEPHSILHHIEKMFDLYFAYLPRQTPSAEAIQQAKLIAHRGAHDEDLQILENTEAAFAHAEELGCYGIEFDIHATKDNILIVNHDPTLKRIWGHEKHIKDTHYDFIQTNTSIPSLEHVVNKYGKKLHLYIELKTPFTAINELQRILSALTPVEDYHLISLDDDILPNLNLFPKNALLLVPTHNNVGKFCNLSLEQEYGGVLGHYFLFHNRLVRKLRNANQITGVGFVDSKYSLYRELNRGLTHLFTNQAKKVTSHLNDLKNS